MAKRKLALGGGDIEALLEDVDALENEQTIEGTPLSVPLHLIDGNPFQPRTTLTKESIENMAISIKEDGVLQPIILRPNADGRYTLVIGQRRLAGAKECGLEVIPAVTRDISDLQLAILAIKENNEREALTVMEEAEALSALKKQGVKQKEMAALIVTNRLGKRMDERYISHSISLTRLPSPIRGLYDQGVTDKTHTLLSLSDSYKKNQKATETFIKDKSNISYEEATALAKTLENKDETKQKKEDAVSSKKRESKNFNIEINVNEPAGKLFTNIFEAEPEERDLTEHEIFISDLLEQFLKAARKDKEKSIRAFLATIIKD